MKQVLQWGVQPIPGPSDISDDVNNRNNPMCTNQKLIRFTLGRTKSKHSNKIVIKILPIKLITKE